MRKIDLNVDIIASDIVFIYGAKDYTKYMRKKYDMKCEVEYGGLTTIMTKGDEHGIVIVVRNLPNILQVKGLVVHELSHAVTEVMDYYGFKCDEFRSYLLQSFYQTVMQQLDKWIRKDR